MSLKQNADGEESDNDSEDFGGFEAAAPAAPSGAPVFPEGLEASPSPWALFPTVDGSMNARPDLLCGQNRFPELLDPAVSVVEPASADGGLEIDSLHNNVDVGNNAPFAEGPHQLIPINSHHTLPVDILSGNVLGNRMVNGSDAGLAASPDIRGLDLPALGAALNEPVVRERPDLELGLEMEGAVQGLEAAVVNYPPDPEEIGERGEHPVRQQEESVENNESPAENQELIHLRDLLHKNEAEKERLETQMISAQCLEEKLKDCELEVASQKQKYQHVQAEHQETLEAMQKSGHDALAVVVKEYKELCKTAVLEQQAMSQREVLAVIQAECCKFQELLQQQDDKIEKLLNEEKMRMKEMARELIEEQTKIQQTSFESFLEKERAKSGEVLSQAIKEEKELSKREIELAVTEEREQTKKLLDAEREKFNAVLREERETSCRSLSETVRIEREQSEKSVKTALEEERLKHKDLVKQALDVAREEMQSYIKEQKQLDATVRKRQFATLDLFLQSARHQLNLLMDSSNPDSVEERPPND
ncbi:hypothetical protein ScPMuIL_015076 [Solemya velum]